jgi:hypothetical protein
MRYKGVVHSFAALIVIVLFPRLEDFSVSEVSSVLQAGRSHHPRPASDIVFAT